MPCCVPMCPGGETELVLFPKDGRFQERWLEAIQVGTDISAELENGSQKRHQRAVCRSHFPDPENLNYQEPTRFVTSKGKTVRVESCRLCHRFELETLMVPLAGQLSGQCLSTVVHQTIKIRLKAEDFLRVICQDCLATVDMIRAMQSQFLYHHVKFQGLGMMRPKLELVPSVQQQQQEVFEISDDDDEYEEVEFVWEPGECNTTMLEIEVGVLPPTSSNELPKPIQCIVKEETASSPMKPKQQEITLEVELLEETTASVKREKSKSVKPKPRDGVKERKKFVPQLKPKPKPKGPKKIEDRQWFIGSRTCYICSTAFEDKNELLFHLTEEHAGKIDYACQECDGKRFPLLTTYNWHLSLHDPKRPLKCSFCPIRYCFPNSLRTHENKFHGTDHKVKKWRKTKKDFQCESCGKLFLTGGQAQEHKLLVHEKQIVWQCKICAKTFANNANLKRHMVLHTDERPYECEICGKRFRIGTDRNKHVMIEHEHKEGYRCNECDIPLADRNDYFRHRQKYHQKSRKTVNTPAEKCPLCPEVVENTKELESHIASVHAEDEYPYQSCHHCPKKFLSKKQLYSHNYNKHQRSFTCEVCGMQFTDKGNMNRHVSVVHADNKRFQCDHCPMKFGAKNAMLNHRRNIHTGERPFKCETCGKKFKDHWTFHKHRKTCASSDESEDDSEASED